MTKIFYISISFLLLTLFSISFITPLVDDAGTSIDFTYAEVINYSAIIINATSNMTNCWDTSEGIKCDVSDITYDEVSGGDVNALGYTGTFNFLAGVVGQLSMDGDPWYLAGTDLEIADNLTVDGNSYLSDTFPRTTLTYSLGSGALRWLKLWVQDINAENIDAFNLDLSNNLTVGGNVTIDGLINGINVSNLSGNYLELDGSNANQEIDINGNKLTMGEFNSTFANGYLRSYLYTNYFNLAGLNIPMLSGFFTTPYGDFNAFGIENGLWVVGNDYAGNPSIYGKPDLNIILADNKTNEMFIQSFNGSNKNVDFFISDATAGGYFTFNKEVYIDDSQVCTGENGLCNQTEFNESNYYNASYSDSRYLQNGTYINATVLEVGGVAITNWSEVNQSGSAGLWEDDGTYLQPLDTGSQSVNVSDINVEGEIQHENKTMIYMDDSGGVNYVAQI